jgi:phosphohistidine phosphatase
MYMKELTIIRHAKSDWGYEGLADIDRPLNQRGYTDAYVMGNWLAQQGFKDMQLISSPAVRSISTAFIFCRALGKNANEVVIEPMIYEAYEIELKHVISKISNGVNHVVLFGHNPGFTNLCNDLTDDFYFDNIPTCGLIHLSFNVKTWSEVSVSKGKVVHHKFPKLFNA